ncbi:hypothetical protein DAEQUDRAFT_71710 [Daedalea quercina L-15889]|uniref:Uncharacterized protein n=1 Tax=Daedalea quercina L-15889 TaxID=1314783 RepID=A0A165L599_9APHY|nr:hypothetical protein DAEQUDRAFT_71710 [Daedalea quercina L-15889]
MIHRGGSLRATAVRVLRVWTAPPVSNSDLQQRGQRLASCGSVSSTASQLPPIAVFNFRAGTRSVWMRLRAIYAPMARLIFDDKLSRAPDFTGVYLAAHSANQHWTQGSGQSLSSHAVLSPSLNASPSPSTNCAAHIPTAASRSEHRMRSSQRGPRSQEHSSTRPIARFALRRHDP